VPGEAGTLAQMTPAEATLLYDGDCGFCRWSADAVLRLDRRRRLRMLALQSEEASGLLPGMSQERRMSSWHLVAADGRVWSGGSAIAPLLRRLPGGRPAAAVADAFPNGTDRAYTWVSRHRELLGRMLGRRAC